MFRTRLGLVVLAIALLFAVSGGFSSSSGQSSSIEPGVVYGGPKAGDQAWLRFGGSRRLISALELPWAVSRDRCSNHRGFYDYVYAGAEYSEPIFVGGKGTFRKRVDDTYRDQGTRYVETVDVVGKVTDEKVSGTIKGRVRMDKPDGSVVRCDFGPQRWVLFD
jgi:hypothetical protein